MSNSFKADSLLIEKITNFYKEFEVQPNNDTMLFKASCADFSVLVYKTGTVLFQGKKASEEVLIWNSKEEEERIDHIGSDEVGCGDYFGPIVVCSAYVKKDDYDYLLSLGVRDSKQLSDESIVRIAGKIKERVKSVTFVLSNKKYNEIHDDYNMNKIKAWLHNFVLYKIVHDNHFDGTIVVDQFCEESLFYKYLADYKTKEIQRGIYFTTKAENKFLAVACASIIARATFLEKMDEMRKETGYNILLGASSDVDKLAKKILDERGLDYLSNYVKIHFKNTKNIIEKES